MSSDKWELPKPVFRTTSGSLPPDFPASVRSSAAAASKPEASAEADQILSSLYAPPVEAAEAATEAVADAQPSAEAVMPQPYISEEFTVEAIKAAPPEAKRKKSGRLGLLIGLVITLLLIALLCIAAYLIFFRPVSDNLF